MQKTKSYQDLRVWQKADLIFDMVCEDVKKWPRDKIADSISYQLLDSSGSISANIAEGYGRGFPGEFEQFLRYSRGSLEETDNWLYKAMKRKFISQERYDKYHYIFITIKKMISSFINKLRLQPRKKNLIAK